MSGDLVGPIRGDEHDVLVDQAAREELEQVPRDRVGPVEVLKGDDHGTTCVAATEMADQLEYGSEQPSVRRVGQWRCARAGGEPLSHPHLGEQARGGPTHLAKQIGDRRERDGVTADVRRATEVQPDTISPRRFADERRLPDAGVTGDEQHGRQPAARVRDGVAERGEFATPTNEVLSGQPVAEDAVAGDSASMARCRARLGVVAGRGADRSIPTI